MSETKETPWRKVVGKFGMTPADFARALGRDRSKITRHLKDDAGLIHGRDALAIKRLAKDRGVKISDSDLTPSI